MATRYQHTTDSSGSVTSTKVTNTNTGKSYTKTYGRRSSGGSSSSSSTSSAPKKYVDRFGVVRVEGGTGYNPIAYESAIKSGKVSSSGTPTIRVATYGGRIRGKYYDNLTQKELELKRLSPNSIAKENVSRSKFIQGTANSRDLLNVISNGSNTMDLGAGYVDKRTGTFVNTTFNRVQDLLRLDQNRKVIQSTISQEQLSKLQNKPVLTQGKLLSILGRTPTQQADYKIFKDSRGRVIGLQDPFNQQSYRIEGVSSKEIKQNFKEQQLGKEFRDTIAQVQIKKNVAKWDRMAKSFDKINKRINRSQAKRSAVARKIDKFIANGKKYSLRSFLGKKTNKFIDDLQKTLLIAPYDLTIGLSKLPAQMLDVALFKIAVVIQGDFRKTVIDEQVNILKTFPKEFIKSIDIRTGEGLANLIILASFIKVSTGGRGAGAVKNVKSMPKTSKARVGTIFKDASGRLSIVTKGGRVVKVPVAKAGILKRGDVRGTKIRVAKTKVARLTKQQLSSKVKLTKAESKFLRSVKAKKSAKAITKEGNNLARRYKLTGKSKAKFLKAYAKFRKNPSARNFKVIQSISERARVQDIVTTIDKNILKSLKPKVKTKGAKVTKVVKELDKRITTRQKGLKTRAISKKKGVSQTAINKFTSKVRAKARSLGATKKQISSLNKVAEKVITGKKGARAKLNSALEKLRNKKAITTAKESLSKADSLARREGFKSAKQKLQYDRAWTEYKAGVNTKANGKILSKIENILAKSKLKVSKLASKRFTRLRNQLIREAEQLLKEGRIKIKNKKYTVTKAKQKMTKTETKELAIAISQGIKKRQMTAYDKQAKEVYKEILNGRAVNTVNKDLLSAIKRFLNKEKLKMLREKKLLTTKGKQPKTRLSKPTRKDLRLKAVERILREKQISSQRRINLNKERIALRRDLKITETKSKQPKSVKKFSKAERKTFTRELKRSPNDFRRIQAEVVKKYKTPNGIKAFSSNGRLEVKRYGFDGRTIKISRVDKVRLAINKQIAKVVQRNISKGKTINGIPRRITSLLNKKVRPTKISLSKVQRKRFRLKVVEENLAKKKLSTKGKLKLEKERIALRKELKITGTKGKQPKSVKKFSKAERKAFLRDLKKKPNEFARIQAEVVKKYKTPNGIKAFSSRGKLEVKRYGFDGRTIKISRVDKVRLAINKKIAVLVEKEILRGKIIKNIPRRITSLFNREPRTLKVSLSKVQRKKLIIKSRTPVKKAITNKKARRSFVGNKKARKITQKKYLAEIQKEGKRITRFVNRDKNLVKHYSLKIDVNGNAKLVPKATIPKKLRIRSASNIIKKSKVPKGSVKVNKDGTIQILKTKKVTVLEKKLSPLEKIGIREAELRRIWRKIGTKKARKIPSAGGKATIKRPVPKKTKRITRTKSSTPKFKLKLLTAPTVTVGIFLGNKIKNKLNQSLVSLPELKSKVALSSASKSAQRIASKQVQVIKQKLKQLVKTAVILKSDVAVLLDVATTQAQKSALKSELKQITELIQKIRAKTKTINETKLPKLIQLPKLSWNKKAPRGKVYVVNPIVRIKGRNVELKWKTTPNLARRRIESAVDNSTTRSYSLKIVGIKKGRDVSRKQSIKFRKRVGKDTRVQFNVEKTRFLIDTSGEKRGLKIARLIKKRANPKPKKAKRKVTRVRSKPKRKARKPTKRKAKRITPKKANKSHKKTTKRTKK